MAKGLSKSVINRPRFKNRYMIWPSRENFLAYKKAKKLRNSVNKKRKTYFEKATENGIMGSIKSFGVQSNLSFHQKASFIMMAPIEIDNKVKDEIELAKTFNSHYKHPTTLGTLARIVREKEIVTAIIQKSLKHFKYQQEMPWQQKSA